MDEWIAFVREAQDLPWVRAIVVIGVSALVAKIVDLLISRFLLRLTLRTNTDLDDQLVQLLHRPVFVSVILVGLYIAVKTLGWSPSVERVVVALIQTAGVFVWTGAGFRLTSTVLTGLSRLADRVTWLEARTLPLFDNLSKIVVFSLAIYCFLVAWDLDLSAWLASAGIMGIAVGFAAKDSLANLFGGLFVIMDAPYKLGDFINLDSGERGRVIKIGLRSTRLLTRDDVEITLPNSHIANSKVVNESGGPYEKTRVAISVGVAYGSDVEGVREILETVAREHPEVITDGRAPAPRALFMGFGDSSLDFELRVRIQRIERRFSVTSDLNFAIDAAFRAAGVSIPYPQRDLHIVSYPDIVEKPAEKPKTVDRPVTTVDYGTRSHSETVDVAADVADLWTAISNAESMKKWLIVDGEFSPFVGGGFDMALRDGYQMAGRTDIYLPHRRLRAVISLEAGEEPLQSGPITIEFTLRQVEKITTVTVNVAGIPDSEDWEEYYRLSVDRWSTALAELKSYLLAK